MSMQPRETEMLELAIKQEETEFIDLSVLRLVSVPHKTLNICPCTVDDPPDSEAENLMTLNQEGKNEKKSPCPTKGPVMVKRRALCVVQQDLDLSGVYKPDDIMSDVN
ncbi:unnamed protein product [Chrysodeixis includens]|uniref:Uncharacterized protein n=1 Tax=Chrysodeixis includens TaxID=689277 RepID=A0A9N8L1R2_CHRIL|nr:unnamed protein product [Chrysodeixis includens]